MLPRLCRSSVASLERLAPHHVELNSFLDPSLLAMLAILCDTIDQVAMDIFGVAITCLACSALLTQLDQALAVPVGAL